MAIPDQQNGAALHFALNRLMQAQQAGLLGPNNDALQFHGVNQPQALLEQYHRYSPTIAHQIHSGGAVLNAPTPAPLPAPPQPQPLSAPQGAARQPAPLAANGGHSGGAQSQQIKVNVTLPGHATGAAHGLLQSLMGMGR